MTLHQVSVWLAATPASSHIRAAAWIVPTVQSVHIVAVSVVIGSALLLNLRLMGIVQNAPIAAYARRYAPWLGTAVLVLMLTGATLIVGEPNRAMENWVFWTKMALVAGGVILTATLALPVIGDAAFWDFGIPRAVAKLLAAVSLMVWIAVAVCGRWIAYVL
jgi:hypothetical protein